MLPALIRKAHEAKVRGDDKLSIWGSGRPMREFLYVDEMADACVFLMQKEDVVGGIYNVGSGTDVTISRLAKIVVETVNFSGDLVFDNTKPDGMMRKLLDVSKMSELGWTSTISLEAGVALAYEAYLNGLK